MNDSNWLANFLNKQREIIEAAETPFAKLAIFMLPILAPSVPATLTGLHLYKLLLQIFDFSGSDTVSRILAIIASVVLELLGYVGAVSFIQSLFRWIRTRQDEYLLPAGLNGIAYIFYLIFMWLINVELGKYFGTPPIMNNIVGLLSFITVPTSLLAANHLSQREEKEDEDRLRQEARQDKMERYRIKHESSKTTSESDMEVPKDFQNYNGNLKSSSVNMGRPSIHQERVFQFMEQYYSETRQVPSFTEVMHNLKLPQSTASRLREKWIESKSKKENEQ